MTYTYDELIPATAQEAGKGQWPTTMTSTAEGSAGTSGVFAGLGLGSAITTSEYHNCWVYLRRQTGTASAGGATSITMPTGVTWTAGALNAGAVRIVGGTGEGQTRTITSNSGASPDVLTTTPAWTTNPDSTSEYEVYWQSSTTVPGNLTRTSKTPSSSSVVVADGTLTWAPAMSNSASGSAVVIKAETNSDFLFLWDLHPDLVKSYINLILRNLHSWVYMPVTMVSDGDMEDSYTIGTTESFTQWWRTNSNVTASKSSTSYPFRFGRQYIDVATSAAISRGIQSATMAVTPRESLYVSVFVQKTPAATEAAAFNVILYDVTNGAALKTVTVTGQQPVIVWFQESLDSTTEEVAVQVVSATAAGTSFRVGPVCVTSNYRLAYPLDTSTFPSESHIIDAQVVIPHRNIETDVWMDGDLAFANLHTERDDRSGLLNARIDAPYATFLRTLKPFTELANDLDTTTANQDLIVRGVMYHLEMERAARLSASNPQLGNYHRTKAQAYAKEFSAMLSALGIPPVLVNELSPDLTLVR